MRFHNFVLKIEWINLMRSRGIRKRYILLIGGSFVLLILFGEKAEGDNKRPFRVLALKKRGGNNIFRLRGATCLLTATAFKNVTAGQHAQFLL